MISNDSIKPAENAMSPRITEADLMPAKIPIRHATSEQSACPEDELGLSETACGLHAGLLGPLPDMPPLLASKLQYVRINNTGGHIGTSAFRIFITMMFGAIKIRPS